MIFVQAKDGLFYTNPRFIDRYVEISFDPEQGCVSWVRCHSGTTRMSSKKRTNSCIKKNGLTGRAIEFLGEGTWLFDDRMHEAMSWAVDLTDTIPVPNRFDQKVEQPDFSQPFYAKWLIFPVQDVLDTIQGLAINRALIRLITDQNPYSPPETVRQDVIESLYKALPGLARFKKNPENFFGEQTKVPIESKRLRRTIATL